jgi:EAL domain-containing protein (putative c-di-GMP-specific phosphodiesterase class I)/ActR/RegA family two-component response regulator
MAGRSDAANAAIGEFRALVIDDHPFVRRTLVKILSTLGASEMMEAADGDEAIALVRNAAGSIDIIFCDLQLPGRDGIQLLRDLAELGTNAGIVLISGENEDVLKAAANLAAEYGLNILGSLAKPIGADQVREVIAAARAPRGKARYGAQVDVTVDELRRAVANREIIPHYQPKVRMDTRELESVEALARWEHVDHGRIGPNVFIPIAQENDLVDDLTNVVLDHALAQCEMWKRQGLSLQLAINLSVDSLDRLNLPEYIESVVVARGLDTSQIVLEVTESRISDNPIALLDIATRLRLKRFELSIDDFGTGFSSLQQLQRLPFSELKVDQAFVTGAVNDNTARSILESSIDLAQKLGMKIVVEGIETREDWDLVESLGCDLAQGYYIARPMPAAEILEWLDTWREKEW